MKTVGIVLCNVAIALGIVLGRMDYEREKQAENEAAAQRVFEEAPPQAVAAPRGAPARKKRTEQTLRDEDLVSLAAPEGGKDKDAARGRGSGEAASGDVAADSAIDPLGKLGQYGGRLDKLAALLSSHDFRGAEAAAKALADETSRGPISVHDRALRLEAKARVFENLVSRMPKAEASASEPVTVKASEVLLANGNRILAIAADEDADRYVFKLEGGAIFTPRREDVLEVRPVNRQVSLAPGWPDLQQKISRLDDAVLLFVVGVERCYRMGFRNEGLEVLDRILGLPDSDQIPLLFIPDADEAVLRDWQVAAGRRPSGAGDAAGSEAVDPGSIAKVERLFGQAQALYQAAAGKDGREGDLKTARERLQEALDVVETLPPGDAEVRKVRWQLGQLLSDVVRALPF